MFLPEDHPPFEDEEKAEETRLCASRDREDRGVLNIIMILTVRTMKNSIDLQIYSKLG